MKRLFIAVRIETSEKLLELLASFRKELKEAKIRWTDPGSYHITLAFLGDTRENQIPAICTMLKAACSQGSAFELRLKGAGVFRNNRDPRVLWARLEHSAELDSLFIAVSSGLKAEGIGLEDRPFSPHLTLGRVKHIPDTKALETLITRYSSTEIQVQHVDELILYESILRPEGPVYKPLGIYPLGL